MYNVANSIITDRKLYRCIFKVSFYFRGSLNEINVFLPLFLQIEVFIDRKQEELRNEIMQPESSINRGHFNSETQ